MKTGVVLISDKIRRMTEAETQVVVDLIGADKFEEATEIGDVYREYPTHGFWYVGLAYQLPGAVILPRADGMSTHLLSAEEAQAVTDLLGSNTFNPAVETGKLYSRPYIVNGVQLGSVQWYPGNDDNPVPPLK